MNVFQGSILSKKLNPLGDDVVTGWDHNIVTCWDGSIVTRSCNTRNRKGRSRITRPRPFLTTISRQAHKLPDYRTYCPVLAYLASTASFCGRHQASLALYHSTVS